MQRTNIARLNGLFDSINNESPRARQSRWRGYFDRIAADAQGIVLFGAGLMGEVVLGKLREVGVRPKCFSDNDQSRWGKKIGGVPILSPEEAVETFGRSEAFVVTIFNGSSACRQLRDMQCRYVLPLMALFWKYPDQFMPNLGIGSPDVIAASEIPIRHFFDALADDKSKDELCNQLQWRYWLDPEYLPYLPDGELYFPDDLVRWSEREVFLDCGSYNGDTITSYLSRNPHFDHLYASEPDPNNRSALLLTLDRLSPEIRRKITVLPYAFGCTNGIVNFSANADVTSTVDAGVSGIQVESRRIDSLQWDQSPTFIKMDIEGAEPEAVGGSEAILKEFKPVLAICLYHRSEHLWEIPNFIKRLQPDYNLFLRRYAEDCWEMICYAVPTERLRA